MQGRLRQTKVYHRLFCSVSKEASHNALKVAAAKKSFPSVFIIDTTCFDEYFLFYVITGNRIFYTNLTLPRGSVPPPCCWILWNECFERSPHFTSVISTIILQWCLYQRFKIKLLFKSSQKNFWKCSTFFLINGIFKSQKLPGGMLFSQIV